jgi:hypothetical protein
MATNQNPPVQAIDTDVKLNKALWILTNRMAEIKG